MASSKKAKKPTHNRLSALITGIGIGLVIFSGFILYRLFHDPLRQELTYAIREVRSVTPDLSPVNTDFALTIDKIGASAKIIKNVDSQNSQIYQRALSSGIAHAKGTKLPGENGNIFLFAHSSADLLTAERYNSVFYLLHHLEAGDIINVWYQGVKQVYTVTDKKIVSGDDSYYLTRETESEQLTLMTCWPPGTSLKRLLVIAKPL